MTWIICVDVGCLFRSENGAELTECICCLVDFAEPAELRAGLSISGSHFPRRGVVGPVPGVLPSPPALFEIFSMIGIGCTGVAGAVPAVHLLGRDVQK